MESFTPEEQDLLNQAIANPRTIPQEKRAQARELLKRELKNIDLEAMDKDRTKLGNRISVLHGDIAVLDIYLRASQQGNRPLLAKEAWEIHKISQANNTKCPLEQLDMYSGLPLPDRDISSRIREAINSVFGDARVILWAGDTWSIAVSSFSAFDSIVLKAEELPLYPEHWIFDRPWECDEIIRDYWQLPENALWISTLVSPYRLRTSPKEPIQRGLMLAFYFLDTTKHTSMIRIDQGFPTGTKSDVSFRSIFRAALFFRQQQRVTEESENILPRAERRRAQKKGEQLPEIRTVTLRKIKRARDSTNEEEKHKPVKWSCRWLVHHHIRRWKDKTTGEIRPVYVSDYVKGPEDKPLRASRPTVYKVMR